MAQVYLSIGSNIERTKHINSALNLLSAKFDKLTLSSVYESEAVGFSGDNFYNLVVGLNTALSVGELAEAMRQIEDDNGRSRSGPKFSARTLDVDILTYDDVVGRIDGVVLPREEITVNAFVLQPLAEIAPRVLHPQLKVAYQTLWQNYDKSAQKLWTVDFEWQQKSISRANTCVNT